jgi:hypothetical protein
MAQLLHELREPDWRDLKEPDLKNKFWPDSTKIIKKIMPGGEEQAAK